MSECVCVCVCACVCVCVRVRAWLDGMCCHFLEQETLLTLFQVYSDDEWRDGDGGLVSTREAEPALL